jgi:hypothetical protein
VAPDANSYPDHFLANPLLISDQATLFPDGWIAIAAISPYRVDWLPPGRGWIRGSPLPFAEVPVLETERRAAMGRAFAGLDSKATPTSVLADWPAFLPPFLDDALVPLPTGHLMIRRASRASEAMTRHDLINRQGVLVAILEVGGAERLVGVGKRGLYVAATDQEGTVRLYRHPLPQIDR